MLSLIGLVGLVPATLYLVGCGGGAVPVGGTGTSRATVLLTDSLREDYDSVWATVLKAELIDAGGTSVTLFDDAEGQVLDLRRLRDLSGARYSFLASAEIPAGSYTGVKVTVKPTMTLFPRGSVTGQSLPLTDALARDSSGNVPLNLTFPTPKTLGAGADENLIVDFDLANFKVEGGKVIPALREGPPTGLDNPERHERHEIRGVIARLEGTAPTQTFSLRRRDGRAVPVVTTADTAIFFRGSTTPAALAVNQVVEVQGRYNTTTDRFVATRVVIKNDTTPDDSFRVEVKGISDDVNVSAKTFVLRTVHVSGAEPRRIRVKVVTGDSTIYRSDRGAVVGAERFFNYLTTNPGTLVEAKGSFDRDTDTLTARILKIEDESNDGGWEDGRHGGGNDRGGNDDNEDGNSGSGKK
jgi:hypothetical protein